MMNLCKFCTFYFQTSVCHIYYRIALRINKHSEDCGLTKNELINDIKPVYAQFYSVSGNSNIANRVGEFSGSGLILNFNYSSMGDKYVINDPNPFVFTLGFKPSTKGVGEGLVFGVNMHYISASSIKRIIHMCINIRKALIERRKLSYGALNGNVIGSWYRQYKPRKMTNVSVIDWPGYLEKMTRVTSMNINERRFLIAKLEAEFAFNSTREKRISSVNNIVKEYMNGRIQALPVPKKV